MEQFIFEECLADKVVSMDPPAMIRMVRDYARKVDLALDQFKMIVTSVIEKQEAPQAAQKERSESSRSRLDDSQEDAEAEGPEEGPDEAQGPELEREPKTPRTKSSAATSGHRNEQPRPSQMFVPVDNRNTAWKLGVVPKGQKKGGDFDVEHLRRSLAVVATQPHLSEPVVKTKQVEGKDRV